MKHVHRHAARRRLDTFASVAMAMASDEEERRKWASMNEGVAR